MVRYLSSPARMVSHLTEFNFKGIWPRFPVSACPDYSDDASIDLNGTPNQKPEHQAPQTMTHRTRVVSAGKYKPRAIVLKSPNVSVLALGVAGPSPP